MNGITGWFHTYFWNTIVFGVYICITLSWLLVLSDCLSELCCVIWWLDPLKWRFATRPVGTEFAGCYRMGPNEIKPKDGDLCGVKPSWGNPKVLDQSPGHSTESRPRFDLDVIDLHGPNVTCKVLYGPCLPITCMSLGVKEMRAELEMIRRLKGLFGTWVSSIQVANTFASAKASRRASLVFLDNLRSSYNVILARMLAS